MPKPDYVIEPIESMPFGEMSYVVWRPGSHHALVVDPGFEPQLILDYLRREDLDVEAILNTHGHVDHIAGNAVLKGAFPRAPLIIGRNEAHLLSDSQANLSFLSGVSITSPPADRLVEEAEQLEFPDAGLTLEVREIPGHSPGSVVYICKQFEPAFVLGGDVLFAGSVGRTDLGGDQGQLFRGNPKLSLHFARGHRRLAGARPSHHGWGGAAEEPVRRHQAESLNARLKRRARPRRRQGTETSGHVHNEPGRPARLGNRRSASVAGPQRSPRTFRRSLARPCRADRAGVACDCQADDLVLVPGDISMARNHREIQPDLAWLDRLPGTKVLAPGNHDGWWNGAAKVRPLLRRSLLAVDGDALATHGLVVCGTLGAPVPFDDPEPTALEAMARALAALDRALADAARLRQANEPLVVLWHYPPFDRYQRPGPCVERFEAAGVNACVYGHLHTQEQWARAFQGTRNGIAYFCVPADAIGFRPLRLRITPPAIPTTPSAG